MKLQLKLTVICLLILGHSYGQWTIQPGIGVSNPITGYKTITDGGVLYQLDITKRLSNNRWGIGLLLGWARMHNDNNSSDKFQNARLDQVPILVTADYELAAGNRKPYIGLGLGVSLYNLRYELTPTSGETIFNASFSMMPRLGLRMPVNKTIYPFIEINFPFVMDGAPPGAEKADKATGYAGVALGAAYRF
jgi:hypothetical protein